MSQPRRDGGFPFLDLPKELPFMVYDFLPVRTTHHCVDDNFYEPHSVERLDASVERNRYWQMLDERQTPKTNITLLHKGISGLATLRTSRRISDEAKVILVPKLLSLRAAPIQVIANTFAFCRLVFMRLLRFLCSTICRGYADIEVFSRLSNHRCFGDAQLEYL